MFTNLVKDLKEKKRILFEVTIFLFIISLLVLFSSCAYFLPVEKEIVAPELIKSKKVLKTTAKVRRDDIALYYDTNTSFEPDPIKLVVSRIKIGGIVEKVYFQIGDFVKKGDLIIKLNTDKIDEKIFFQEINFKKAQLQYEEVNNLFKIGRADKYDVELSRLSLLTAENYFNDLKKKREKYFIYSKSDGVIVDINFNKGEYAHGDVFSVCKEEDGVFDIKIPVGSAQDNISDKDRAFLLLNIGDRVLIMQNGVEYEAEIYRDAAKYYIECDYDQEFLHINVKALENVPDLVFKKKVKIRNVVGEAKNALVVPKSTVFGVDVKAPYTYVVKDDEIERRDIEIGINDGVVYEVLSGLEEGEQVLKIN